MAKENHPETLGRRRSTRLSLAVPVVLSGKDADGKEFNEETRTISVNKHGGRMATTRRFAWGAEVTVKNRFTGQSAKANVIWTGGGPDPQTPKEVGIQLQKPQNIWGVDFPPEDWERPSAVGQGQAAAAPEAPKPSEAVVGSTTATSVAAAERPPAAPPPAPPRPAGLTSPPPAATPEPGPAMAALIARFHKSLEEASQRQSKVFEERLAKLASQACGRAQVDLEALASATLEKIRTSTELLSQQLRQTADEVRDASAHALASQAERAVELLKNQLESTQEQLIKETKDQLAKLSQMTVEYMDQEGRARVDEYEDRFSTALLEEGSKSLQEISAEMERTREKQLEAFREQLQKAREELEAPVKPQPPE